MMTIKIEAAQRLLAKPAYKYSKGQKVEFKNPVKKETGVIEALVEQHSSILRSKEWPAYKIKGFKGEIPETDIVKVITASAVNAGWFSDMSLEEQRKYKKEHPHSKYTEQDDDLHDNDYLDDAKEGDKERIAQLKSQIKETKNDIREIEEEDDDAGPEKKHLKSLEDELRGLEA